MFWGRKKVSFSKINYPRCFHFIFSSFSVSLFLSHSLLCEPVETSMTREWVPLRTLSFIMAVKEEKTVSVLEWYVGKTSICLIFTTSNTATFEKKDSEFYFLVTEFSPHAFLEGLLAGWASFSSSSPRDTGMECFVLARCRAVAMLSMPHSFLEGKTSLCFIRTAAYVKPRLPSFFLLHPVCLCFAFQGERPRMSIVPPLVFDKFRLVSSWQKSEDLLTEIIIQSNRGDHAGVELIYWFLSFRFLSCFYLFFIVFVYCKRVKQQ